MDNSDINYFSSLTLFPSSNLQISHRNFQLPLHNYTKIVKDTIVEFKTAI